MDFWGAVVGKGLTWRLPEQALIACTRNKVVGFLLVWYKLHRGQILRMAFELCDQRISYQVSKQDRSRKFATDFNRKAIVMAEIDERGRTLLLFALCEMLWNSLSLQVKKHIFVFGDQDELRAVLIQCFDLHDWTKVVVEWLEGTSDLARGQIELKDAASVKTKVGYRLISATWNFDACKLYLGFALFKLICARSLSWLGWLDSCEAFKVAVDLGIVDLDFVLLLVQPSEESTVDGGG